MQEIFKDIPGYEGFYQVSNLGNVKTVFRETVLRGIYKRTVTEKLLKQHADPKGYYKVKLYKDGKKETKKVHRLVAISFIPNPENKEQINHIDGIKSNNTLSNLEWCTNGENSKHAYKIGLKMVRNQYMKEKRPYKSIQ